MDFSSLALPFLILIFLLGLFLIVKGGDAFVDAASWIAAKSGIPPFIIGATIVSLATTLPELLVSVFATLNGSAAMAVGNAIGSVTANTGFILAISLLAMPSAAPRKTFCTKGILLLATIFTLFFATRGGTLLPIGQVTLWLLLFLFLAENVYAARQGNLKQSNDHVASKLSPTTAPMDCHAPAPNPCADMNSDRAQAQDEEQGILLRNIALFLLGAAGIAAGSQLLVASATELATRLHVPEVVIAVTIVAVGTALPELVTALTAIAKKEAGLSAGNILGANIIDTALILPLCSLLNKGGIAINPQSLVYDIPACLLCICIAVIPALFTQKLQRWQGGMMLAVYLIYLTLVTF